jgi:hypothetical protein
LQEMNPLEQRVRSPSFVLGIERGAVVRTKCLAARPQIASRNAMRVLRNARQ